MSMLNINQLKKLIICLDKLLMVIYFLKSVVIYYSYI